MPRAEILLATYNGERFLTEQLNSLLNQSWQDLHITISDDCSTDHTPDLIKAYAEQYPEKITWVKHGHHFGNARDHFFFLMNQCQEDYMLFCDQDDVWNTDKAEITMQTLLHEEALWSKDTPVLVCTDQIPADVHLQPLAPSLMRMQKQDASVIDYRRLLLQNIVTGCTTGINRTLAKKAVCIKPEHTIMHDWWLGLVAARFGRLVYVDRCTMLYRQHGNNSVGAKNVSGIGYIFRKLSHLKALRQQILHKKAQAACFAETYASLLSIEEKAFLQQFSLPKSGAVFYLKNRHLFSSFFRFAGALILG